MHIMLHQPQWSFEQEDEARDPPDTSDQREHYYCPADYGGPIECRDDGNEEREDTSRVGGGGNSFFFDMKNNDDDDDEVKDECVSPVNCFYNEEQLRFVYDGTMEDVLVETRDDAEAAEQYTPPAIHLETTSSTTDPTIIATPPSGDAQPTALQLPVEAQPIDQVTPNLFLSTIDEEGESDVTTSTSESNEDKKLASSLKVDHDAVSSPRESRGEPDAFEVSSPDGTTCTAESRASNDTKGSMSIKLELSLLKTFSGLVDVPYLLPSQFANAHQKEMSLDYSGSEDVNDIVGQEGNEKKYTLKESITDVLDSTSPVVGSPVHSASGDSISATRLLASDDKDEFSRPQDISEFLHITEGFDALPLSPMNTHNSDADDAHLSFGLGKGSTVTYDSYHDKDVALERQYRRKDATGEIIRSLSSADDSNDMSQLELMAIVDIISSSKSGENEADGTKQDIKAAGSANDFGEVEEEIGVAAPAAAAAAVTTSPVAAAITDVNATIEENGCFGYDDFFSVSAWDESFRSALLDCQEHIANTTQEVSKAVESNIALTILQESENIQCAESIEHAIDSESSIVKHSIEEEQLEAVEFVGNNEQTADVDNMEAGLGTNKIHLEDGDNIDNTSEQHITNVSAKATPEPLHINTDLEPPDDDSERRDGPEEDATEDRATETNQLGAEVSRHRPKVSTEALFIRSKSLSPLSRGRETANDDDEALILSISPNFGMSIGGEDCRSGKNISHGVSIDPEESDVLSEVSVESAAFAKMSPACACIERRPCQC